MDDTTQIPTRQRLVVAAIAVVVTVLAMLRPTPDLTAQTDGVNRLPDAVGALAGER